jgi:hypothetical protein
VASGSWLLRALAQRCGELAVQLGGAEEEGDDDEGQGQEGAEELGLPGDQV